MTRFDVAMPRSPSTALPLLCAAALLITGCGTHTFPLLDESGSAPLSVDDVMGTLAPTAVIEQGDVPLAPWDARIVAQVLEDGAFTSYPGTLTFDGKFHIPGVPHTTFYLGPTSSGWHGTRYLVTSKRFADLGELAPGRFNLEMSDESTQIELSADGLSPGIAESGLNVYSLDGLTSGTFARDYTATADQTSVSAIPIVSMDNFARVHQIDASRGDITYAMQKKPHPGGDGQSGYESLSDLLTTDAFTVHNGGMATLTGTFHPVPQKSFSFSWKGSAFAALAADVNPTATMKVNGTYVQVQANPAGAGRSLGDVGSPDLLLTTVSTSDTDFDLVYGNGFPAGWTEVLKLTVFYDVPTASQESTVDALGPGRLTFEAPLDEIDAVPIVPVLSPPRNLTINGQSAGSGLAGIGTSPQVSWEAPSLGEPTLYHVEILRKEANQAYWMLGTITTDETTIVVPPEYLEMGNTYVVTVTASNGSTMAVPYRNKAHFWTASTTTGLLTP